MTESPGSDVPTEVPSQGPSDLPDDVVVLPWWYSKLNVAVVIVAVAVLAAATGWYVGDRDPRPGAHSVDVGFLQDMRSHHQQAVQMATIYLTNAPDGNEFLRDIAREIQFGQAIEIGQMVQILRGFHADETNPTDTAMSWMHQPVPLERMPGLASDADLQRLAASRGRDADTLFVGLMVAHHQGGIAMARYAQQHSSTSTVRKLAESMVKGQSGEISEMQQLLASSAS